MVLQVLQQGRLVKHDGVQKLNSLPEQRLRQAVFIYWKYAYRSMLVGSNRKS